ncbi:acyltransferase family protein [Mycobacterium avium]|uniref:acyltransferase family protein n=1 Tax=Mycobacterium avium TaxID=1764 RepID=UPI0005785A9D|nr:acyltransferase [Mycobacterium avium]AZP80862.1 acyltransferase [Mycobacterium avium subsp. paratuberculosis]WPS77840.1 acyltransferase [Mycobacterium avium subsp. paratuberculosis]
MRPGDGAGIAPVSADPNVSDPTTIAARGPARRRVPGPTLAQVFDTRINALNVWRLTLASGVILQHSWPLTGRKVHPPYDQLFTQVWVDGFFAISGFLIAASWVRNPRLREYVAARALRILPGLWVCLVVIAFVIAPIAVAIQGGSAAKLLMSRAPIEYVLHNAVLHVFYAGIDGTPRHVPFPGVWDGVLWTLIFEIFCYVAIAVAGVAGLLKRRWPAVVVFILLLVFSALVAYPVEVQTVFQMIGRFALVFAAGTLLHQFQDKIPARWSLVALSAVIVLAAGLLVPNYRVLAAIPLAYAVVVSGALIHHERLRLRTDLSYGVYIYAWPMQQLLAICGLSFLPPVVFAVVAVVVTLPLAALSWFLVEKRTLSLKSRIKRRARGWGAVVSGGSRISTPGS